MALSSARNASAAIPTIRNGIDKSQTIGHKTSATNAIGQHNTSKIDHNSNMSNTLIVCLPCPRVSAYLTYSRGSVISQPPSLKVSTKIRFSPFVFRC